MALRRWAFFYYSPGFHPDRNTSVNEDQAGLCQFVTVGFEPGPGSDQLILDTAARLRDEGVQMIELCGGFGPTWVARINEHLDYSLPVGTVTYGPEFRQALVDINGSSSQRALPAG